MSLANQATLLTPDILKLRIASQFAPWNERRELDRLCASLEAGQGWPSNTLPTNTLSPTNHPSTNQPPNKRNHQHLPALLQAGAAAGHPADIALAVYERRQHMRMTWYEMLGALLYPTLLLFASLAVTSVVGMQLMSYADGQWSKDVQFPHATIDFFDAALGALIMLAWSILVGITIYFVASPNVRLKLLGVLPLLGRPCRWMALSDLLTRLAIFATHRPELARALRLTADSYGDQALAAIAVHVAEATQRGESLQHALHQTILSDQQAGMALTLIELDSNQFVESLHLASQLLQDMTQQWCERVKMVYPVFILLIVASIVWGAWASYMSVFQFMMSSYMSFI